MSSTTTGFPEHQQRGEEQRSVGLGYIPTEEERMLFEECSRESFLYRSLPFSVASMAATQALIANGSLSASPRFGSLPKVALAGLCGYLIGKVSYMKTCKEKFGRLENSPLGEMARQRMMPSSNSSGAQSELNDPDSQSFETMFQPAEAPSQKSYTTESPVQMGKSDGFSAPAESYEDEEQPKRKAIFYEDLRLKNRENYDVMLTQNAETLLKTSPGKEPKRPKKEMKNIYGDTWEE